MPADNIPYRRLPGTGFGAFERIKLYRGPDHLLLVASSGYSESYKRFYFRDIQAFIVHRTKVGMIWNLVLSLVSAPSLLFATALLTRLGAGDLGPGIFWAITAVLAGVPLLINIVRGPTSRCHIRTAVQTRSLPSLNRLRRAQKVIAQLRPFIEAAQEPMSSAELTQRIEETRRGSAPNPAVNVPAASQDPSPSPPTS